MSSVVVRAWKISKQLVDSELEVKSRQTVLEGNDFLSSSGDLLIWLSNLVPFSESSVLSWVGSKSVSVGKDEVSHLDVSDGLGS